jgi:glycosyltransferase involved in cell wall biosynthesis
MVRATGQVARAFARRAAVLAGALPGLRLPHRPITFVAERNDWSIRWDGRYILDNIEARHPGHTQLSDRPWRRAGRVVHFGSHYLWGAWSDALPRGPNYVVTYFHGKPEDGPEEERAVERFLASLEQVSTVVTAATLTENRLLSWGVPRNRLVRIPIGVDLERFAPADEVSRIAARTRWGFAPDAIVVGSFQKDGVGWDEGLVPKRVKGPDIFVEVMRRLRQDFPVVAFLTGPARGFVKAGLSGHNVPFVHSYLDDYRQMVSAYHALDLCLVTSREEGGPKAVVESMATGVPIVSTACGMAPDIIVDGASGGVAPVDDVDGLVERAARVLSDCVAARGRALAARQGLAPYDWRVVAEQHWQKVYAPLLASSSGSSR